MKKHKRLGRFRAQIFLFMSINKSSYKIKIFLWWLVLTFNFKICSTIAGGNYARTYKCISDLPSILHATSSMDDRVWFVFVLSWSLLRRRRNQSTKFYVQQNLSENSEITGSRLYKISRVVYYKTSFNEITNERVYWTYDMSLVMLT